MIIRNKIVALALGGALSLLTTGSPVLAQTGENPIPVAVTTSTRPADKLEAQQFRKWRRRE